MKSKKTLKEKEKEEAKRRLLDIIQPEATLIMTIPKVSRSGMSRRINVYIPSSDEERYLFLNYYISELLELPLNEDGLLVKGCGMDMTFWLADALTYALWRDEKPKGLKGNFCRGGCLNYIYLK